jgi:hypothetical protein
VLERPVAPVVAWRVAADSAVGEVEVAGLAAAKVTAAA